MDQVHQRVLEIVSDRYQQQLGPQKKLNIIPVAVPMETKVHGTLGHRSQADGDGQCNMVSRSIATKKSRCASNLHHPALHIKLGTEDLKDHGSIE